MITVRPFTPEWRAAVQDFNRRLLAGGIDPDLLFPAEPAAEFTTGPGSPLYQQFFLIAEGDTVYGAYFLTHETWLVNGQACPVANYRLPVADPARVGINTVILRDALKRQPHLYCLGMGNYERPLPRTLAALKWPMFTTPFFFRSVRPSRVLRNIASLRSTRLRQLFFDAAASSGAGSGGIRLAQWIRYRPANGIQGVSADLVGSFDHWADELWEAVKHHYRMLAIRNSTVLQIRYPKEDPRFIRLRIRRDGTTIGWAVLLDTPMTGHKHFGNLRVGTIVDCLAAPEHAGIVVQRAAGILEQRGVDLIISNQSHTSWCNAFRRAGFLEGPSNRIFAASPQLGKLVDSLVENSGATHLTRGDGAGPIHL
jgi:hypothetical protein